jgi:4-diphosphocytidyl-2-C-methyl-D-erythritol kinase
MTALRDIARAKLNLTLEVLGSRADGYHELTSLVAFAELGDSLELEPGGELALAIEGPFAQELAGGNLIAAAAAAAMTTAPRIALGRFRLVKTLPVAAGLGGGSADAAAALRLLARANPGALAPAALAAIAAGLGSDVTACLESRPALMTGRGERVVPVQGIPACGVVLVNPVAPLPTADVYATLGAPPLSGARRETPEIPDFAGDFARLIAYAEARGNDLEPAAAKLVPEIADVLAVLGSIDGARLVRLSGSGPTCFALFATEAEAKRAAADVAASQASWWVAASTLRSSGSADSS